MQEESYRGSCLCGDIQYSVSAIGDRIAHCHCTMCRKFHGAAFATFGEARAEDFRWLKGQQNLACYEGNNGTNRYFCRNCGSSMIFEPSNHDGSLVEFSLATLDVDIPHMPDAHIFLRYAANWTKVDDDIKRFLEGRTLNKDS